MTTNQEFNLTGANQKPLSEHPGMRYAYNPNGMTIGVIAPFEGFQGPVPTMKDHAELVRKAEEGGIAQFWVRDVPLLDPRFGDTGQVFDTYTYLGYLAAITEKIALGTASSVLPLRHPLDIAKASASVDQLSGGRFTLGVASGDRAVEFPAYGKNHADRGELFRESLKFIQRAQNESFPEIDSPLGTMRGADLLPKPTHQRLPVFITGTSRQTPEWIAKNADGWLYYTLPPQQQAQNIEAWRQMTAPKGEPGWKPFNQATYFDIVEDPKATPTQIHQGLRLGREALLEFLKYWESIGIDQLMINFKSSTRPVGEVLDEMAEYILPHFPAGQVAETKS